jgi:hypothetical protein
MSLRASWLVLVATMLTTVAIGCDSPAPHSFVQRLEGADRAFVGRVVGFRLDDTTLITATPVCPLGRDGSPDCERFWRRVVTIQYEVEIAIKNIEAPRRYETITRNDDGCAPMVGDRWLTSGWYRDGFSTRLNDPPNEQLIEQWRVIANRDSD